MHRELFAFNKDIQAGEFQLKIKFQDKLAPIVSRALCITCIFVAFAATAQAQSALAKVFSSSFAGIAAPVAGVAADEAFVFVGEPLNASVIVLSRRTGEQIAQLPPPPNGFAVPFIMHIVGPHRVAVLDAGGLPQPSPFVPANPSIYEYTYEYGPSGFTATLARTVSFASVLIGFPEDFVRLHDGVTDRRNEAGDDRLNGATFRWSKKTSQLV